MLEKHIIPFIDEGALIEKLQKSGVVVDLQEQQTLADYCYQSNIRYHVLESLQTFISHPSDTCFKAYQTLVSFHNQREQYINAIVTEYGADLINPIAKHLYRSHSGLVTVQLEDVQQEGNLGLIDAIEKFDPTRLAKFTTYAPRRISGAILDMLRSEGGEIQLPRSVMEKLSRIERARTRISQKLQREPTREEIADAAEMSLEDVDEALSWVQEVEFLDQPLDDYDKETTLYERFLGKDDTQQELNSFFDREEIRPLIKKLPEQEQKVVDMYFYQDMTEKEIGEVLGVSESRVAQIKKSALQKLRRYLSRIHQEE